MVFYDGRPIIKDSESKPQYIEDANMFIVCNKDGRQRSLIDRDGNVLISNIEHQNKYKLFSVSTKEGRGLMTYAGKWIVAPEKGYTDYGLINGFYRVKFKGENNYHLISSNGKDIEGGTHDVIEFVNSESSANNGYFKIRLNGYYGIITLNGDVIIPTSRGYTSIANYDNSKGSFSFTKKGLSGYCDAHGRETSTSKALLTYDEIKKDGGYSSIKQISTNGGKRYYIVSKGKFYGFVDGEGSVIIPCEMLAIEECGTGFLRFKIGDYWGVMNYQGKTIISTSRGYTSIGNYVSSQNVFAYTANG